MPVWLRRWRRSLDRSANYLGIARKAGFLEIGEESAGRAVRHGTAKLLVLAADWTSKKLGEDGLL